MARCNTDTNGMNTEAAGGWVDPPLADNRSLSGWVDPPLADNRSLSDVVDEPVFYDALFRQKRKHGKFRVIDGPAYCGPIADTHVHLQMLPDPALALARAAWRGVGFIGAVSDVCEDADVAFAHMSEWVERAGVLTSAGVLTCAGALLGNDGGAAITIQKDQSVDGEFVECSQVQLASNPQEQFAPNPQVPRVRMIVGCHPHNASKFDDAAEARLRALLADPRVCALGEIGLDYHYDMSPRPVQVEVFRRQIRMAHELGLPIMLHLREAHDVALQVLDEEGFPEAGTILHCFNLGPEVLEPFVKRDCYIAFGGPVTFKQADDVRAAAALVPANRLLTETDGPFMTPEPCRGMVCTPDYVALSANVLAECRGVVEVEQKRQFFARLMENADTILNRPALSWQNTPMEHNATR